MNSASEYQKRSQLCHIWIQFVCGKNINSVIYIKYTHEMDFLLSFCYVFILNFLLTILKFSFSVVGINVKCLVVGVCIRV